jgi:hypothetical protein
MRALYFCVSSAALLWAPITHGDAVNDQVERGLQLRRAHRDADALVLFRQAYEASPAPRTRAQIALAEQALGQWVEAEHDLRDALGAKDDPWIASHREALDGALHVIADHLGTLIVKTNAPAVEIRLDDDAAPALSEGARVVAGQHRIEVRAPGYEGASRTIDVAGGGTATLDLVLRADPPTALEGRASSASEPVEPAPIANPAASRDVTNDGPQLRRAFAWGALGAAGAFLGVAVAAQIVREERAAYYNDDSRCFFGNLSRDARCGVYRGEAESAQTVATVGYVASGVMGLAAGALFLLPFGSKRTARDVTVRFDVGASHAAIGVGGAL